MPLKEEKTVRTTGGQVDELVMALIEAAYDKDMNVREILGSSLFELGRKQPQLVLSSCNNFLTKHSKLPQGHRVVLLTSMEKIIRQLPDDFTIDRDLVLEMIKQTSEELTHTKEVIPEWQNAASSVLVAIGVRHCNDVMSELLDKFQPGSLPHYFVVQTLASLATANVFGMVPFIKACLGTMLPMLGMAKHDNIKWVFSKALASFCEAIIEYVANIEKAPDPNVTKEFFVTEMYAAWDLLFNVWLNSRESKLRSAIIEALGQMSYILMPSKLQECFPKLLPTILSLYKKHQEPHLITQVIALPCSILLALDWHYPSTAEGLYMMLDAACQSDCMVIDPHLDSLLGNLFPQICIVVDYNNPQTVKNHNELLRCFAVLTKAFSNRMISFLLMKLDTGNERVRIGVLAIVRHLVNAAGTSLDKKEDLLLSGLKLILSDPSNKVKKVLAQTIIAMSHHGYLELEGGHIMIEFIVRQCALQPETVKRSADPDYVSNEALRSMCDSVLSLLSTTVENMDQVLWPYMLELLIPEAFTEAVGTLCLAIHNITSRKRLNNDDDYLIDFSEQVNTPKPPEIFMRLLVLSGFPQNGRSRGVNVLKAMLSLGPVIHEKLPQLWDSVLPKLIERLEGNSKTDYVQKTWEDLILKLLSKSLDQVDEEVWTANCGEELAKQIPLYSNMAEEKYFLFKCMGIVMRKSTKKDLVSKLIDVTFENVKHGNQLEREGCAMSMGYGAASHLDVVLGKIDALAKLDAKRSSGFLNFFKDAGGESEEKVKATLMLCLGYVTFNAPPELIQSRLEASILTMVTHQLAHVKDQTVKQNLIRSVDLIGKAMHPDHLRTSTVFSHRNSLLQHMKAYVRHESTTSLTSETRALAIRACATLIKLDPKVSGSELLDIVKALASSVITLPAEPSAQSHEEHSEYEQLMEKTMSALTEFFQEVLLKDTTVETLDLLHQQLYSWTKSTQEHERLRSMTLCLEIFRLYLQKCKVKTGDQFTKLGVLVARHVPRCSDPCVLVRQKAFDCIEVLLRIASKYEGKEPDTKDQFIETLPTLKDKVQKVDPNVMFSAINDLAKVLTKKIPSDQLIPFLDALYEDLLDPQVLSSSGACVVLNGVLKARGGELHSQVDKVLVALYNKLQEIQHTQTKTGTLRAIRTLASHHLLRTMTLLLDDPLPLSEISVEIWHMMGQDQQLAATIVDQLLEMLFRSLPYEEQVDSKGKEKPMRRAMQVPLAVTCALTEMSKAEECEIPIMNCYPRLLAAMLINTASMVGAKPPKLDKEKKDDNRFKTTFLTGELKVVPSTIAVDGLRQIIKASRSERFLEALNRENVWPLLTDLEKFCDGFTILARCMAETQPEFIPKMINNLNPVLSGLYWPQRAMAAAIFAELISQKCGGDMALVDMLVNNLLGRLVDGDQTVRMLCIRGLGNIASAGTAHVQKYCTMVLSAMMAGMDDKEDTDDIITIEAMSGLSKILAEVSESDIQAILINVALRIRPCFEKERTAVRATAFGLFGNLAAFGKGPSKEQFLEQIHTNMVSLLLHLNDAENEVKQACKRALRQLGPLIGSERMNIMFQNHLIESAFLHYGEFINDLSKAIIDDLPDKLNYYVMGNVTFFRSMWSEIRSNAAIFVGFLLGNTPAERCMTISKEHVCGALMLLLKDPEPDVRIRAAEAISLLANI